MYEISVKGSVDIPHRTKPLSALPASAEGLEEFFDHGNFPDKGLTIEQACNFYQLPIKKLKRRIRSGQIEAIKLGISETSDDWRIFPEGIPQAFAAATRVASLVSGKKHKIDHLTIARKNSDRSKKDLRKEEALASDGELLSLRTDVTLLEQRLTAALDAISMLTYELDVTRQAIAHVGLQTTWHNDNLVKVDFDHSRINQTPSEALVNFNNSGQLDNEEITSVTILNNDSKTGWLSALARWFGRKK